MSSFAVKAFKVIIFLIVRVIQIVVWNYVGEKYCTFTTRQFVIASLGTVKGETLQTESGIQVG